jgi:uncharacterized surface protein with fasciclin (FAS1) repeats
MTKTRILTLIGLCLFLLAGCDPDAKQADKYDRPDWLAGKVYTQLLAIPELSTFTLCVELAGYDTIIDRSGTYTVFAPNDDAFDAWFKENPAYNQVEDIPKEELQELVKYHLVQSPWSKIQLQQLDVYGWIDTLDVNNDKPRGYKRETLLMEGNRKLGVDYNNKDRAIQIVDTTQTNWHRMFLTDSRKFSPIFFKDYFTIYDLNSDDYSFYFDRPVESSSDIYFSGAKILGDEVFAENGFVYNIDRVVEPLNNAYEILESETGGQSYSTFLDLVNRFPDFQYNEDATFDQEGADEGFAVDSLFDITFPDLAFDILNEATTSPRGTFGLPPEVSIRYHHGVAAPNDAAMDKLVNDYLAGTGKWGNLENSPLHIKRMIANTHLSTNPIYPTDFSQGIINGENDRVYINPADVVQQQYASNATFIGLSQAIVPRAFSSVTGPVYQLRGYSYSMFAIEQAGLQPALKREFEDYMLFVENDQDCQQDSSLFYNYSDESFYLIQGSGKSSQRYNLNVDELRTLILNHVGVRNPIGAARKEFVKNLAGNYLVINNITGEVSGTAPTSEGYKGDVIVQEIPELISEDADNGNTFRVRNWFSFSAANLFLRISVKNPEFQRLLKKAGLTDDAYNRYTFLSENENYTVFAPTDSALVAIQADTLPIPDLQKLLRLHFVQGALIFTDASSAPGYYETSRIDETSTEFSVVFSSMYIDPGMDIISINDANGSEYVSVVESRDANLMAGRNLGEGTEVFPVVVINSLVHEITRVLQYDELDSN